MSCRHEWKLISIGFRCRQKSSQHPLAGIRDPICRAGLRTTLSFIKLTLYARNPSIYISRVSSACIFVRNCVIWVFKQSQINDNDEQFRRLCGNDTNYMQRISRYNENEFNLRFIESR